MAPTRDNSTGLNDPTPPLWRYSEGKAYLRSLFLDESSWIHLVSVEQAHESEPLFKIYPLKNFKNNFKSLQESVRVEQAAIGFDQRAFEAESTAFPRNEATERGYLFWDGHQAQGQLAKDVKEGRTNGKLPRQLQQERESYQQFPAHVFRQHKYQEERKLKEKVYWQKKRNDLAQKKHHKQQQNQGRSNT